MVDAAGQAFAPDEHEDSFTEYAQLLRRNQALPDVDLGGNDEAATDLLDVGIYLGIGLAVLGQVGLRVLSVVADLAIERSAEGISAAAARLFRRRRGADADPVLEPTAQGAAVILRISEQVATQLGPQIPGGSEQAQLIVTVQLQVLADQDERFPAE